MEKTSNTQSSGSSETDRAHENEANQAIQKIRKKLLDLGGRNVLLNYRHPKGSSLRIIDELPDQIANELNAGKKFDFVAVPEPKERELIEAGYLEIDEDTGHVIELKELPTPKQWAAYLGYKTSYNLPGSSTIDLGEEKHNDLALQTMLFPPQLDSRLRAITGKANSAISETGANILYLTLGFLEWFEDEKSDQIRQAPLVTIPVEIKRGRLDKAQAAYKYTIGIKDDGLLTNITLKEKLKNDFGINLPDYKEEVSPEEYFIQIQDTVLECKPRWAIRRFCTLSLLNFSKQAMYIDLDPKNWPKGKTPIDHPTLKRFLSSWGAESSNGGSMAQEEHRIDEIDDIHNKAPLIYDADSSQHSALIDVIYDNKNLVIEGPPGTGKSQTITNLIAAAIGQGLSVLFVAEKMAALNVVKSRLDEAELGDFCLELHSHKTNKRRILDNLSSRIMLGEHYSKPKALSDDIQRFESFKRDLSHHASLINKPWGETGLSIYEIITKVTRLKLELKIPSDEISTNIESKNITSLKLKELIDDAEMLQGIKENVADQADGESIENHPWFGVRKMDSEGLKHNELVSSLNGWTGCIKVVDSSFTKTMTGFGLKEVESESIESLTALCELVKNLPDHIEGFCFEKLPELVTKNELINDFGEQYKQFYLEKQHLLNIFNESALKSKKEARALQKKAYDLSSLGYPSTKRALETLTDVKKLASTQLALRRVEENLSLLRKNLPDEVMKDFTLTREGIKEFQEFLTLAQILPKNCYTSRNDFYDDDDLDEGLTYLNSEEYQTSCKNHYELIQTINIEMLPSVSVLKAWKGFETKGQFSRLFNAEARRVWSEQRQLYLANKPSKMARRNLQQLIDYREGVDKLIETISSSSSLSKLYRGFETDLTKINQIRRWYKKVRVAYGYGFDPRAKLADFLFSVDKREFQAISDTAAKGLLKDIDYSIICLDTVERNYPSFHGFEKQSSPLLDESRSPIISLKNQLTNLGEGIQENLKKDMSLEDLIKSVDELTKLHVLFDELKNNAAYASLSDSTYCDLEGITTESNAIIQFATKLVNAAAQDHALVAVLSKCSNSIFYSSIVNIFNEFSHEVNKATEAQNTFGELGSIDFVDWFAANGSRCADVIERNSKAFNNQIWLTTWQDFLRVKDKLSNSGLRKLMVLLEDGKLSFGKLPDAINLSLMSELSNEIFGTHPELKNFSGLEQQQRRIKFRDYDKKILKLQRQQIAYQGVMKGKSKIHIGKGAGKVANYTEMSLINKELGKKTRHIPIRDFLHRSKSSIQGLKPCFMMSPMSVAQYLKPGEFNFDIIVMDEASQIRPEDAIGTIARGKLSVVVGDPKQLPPTNFFQKIIGDEGDDVTALDETESILDAVSPIFHSRRLRWHYRSKHESLIAFSNKNFYDSNLVIFPSPYQKSSEYGIRYQKVAKGRFAETKNSREAIAVSEAARVHILKQAANSVDERESLGIVAMSANQKSEIEIQWESLIKEDSELRAAIELTHSSLEPFFIKNLENVQGDDRDVIIISMTYGPEKIDGNVMQRFGPINTDVGWRRLNVLFTRSKKRMHIFSSMSSSDIVISPNSKRGVLALKAFLEYCESGHLHQIQHTGKAPDSDFEIAVMDMLSAHGYECEAQLGVAGYYLDVAVKDPNNSGMFLMGIECDGATYHSAKSARDRDRLRQEILESLGWKISRIWSTDWFKNPEAQLVPILNELEKLKSKPVQTMSTPDTQAEVILDEKTGVVEANLNNTVADENKSINLDIRLKRYGKTVIGEEFENTPKEKKLLRPAMIEALIHHKPTSIDEFTQVIPAYLRQGTDATEAQKFLKFILQMISDYSD